MSGGPDKNQNLSKFGFCTPCFHGQYSQLNHLDSIEFLSNMYQPNKDQRRSALFLANLSNDCCEGDLYNVFSPFGEICGIKVVRPNSPHKSTYGFVNFVYQKASDEAAQQLNGFLMFGLPLW